MYNKSIAIHNCEKKNVIFYEKKYRLNSNKNKNMARFASLNDEGVRGINQLWHSDAWHNTFMARGD